MNGAMDDMGGCLMHDDMMGSKISEARRKMMARRIKSMTPEMRQERMEKIENQMNRMQAEMQMMRDHMDEQPVAAGEHDHGRQKSLSPER